MSYANVARFLTDNLGPRAHAEALVTPTRRYTHETLARSVDRWGHALLAAGVARGERVLIAAQADARYVLTMLALAKIGAVAVPVNTRWAAPEVTYAIDLCEPVLVVADGEYRHLADASIEGATHPPRLLAMDELDSAAEAASVAPLPYADVSFDDPLRILFTSGTTSRPKGVITTHGNSAWNHRVVGSDLGVSPADRLLVCYPMFHVSGLEAPGVFGALATGATCLLLPHARADEVSAFIHSEQATGVVLLPPLYAEVLHNPAYENDLDSLRWVLTGGVTPASMQAFMQRLPGRRLIEIFAMTETTGTVTVLDEAHMHDKAGRVGRAVRHVDVRVVDEQGRPVPAGTPGLLEVRGPKVSRGYWGVSDGPGDGWFATGDIGDLDDDGYLAYRGRAKEMIKSGGENIAMAEVERVINQHPDVFAVCIVRIPHERWGEAPKAYVMPEEGRDLDPDELMEFCRGQLAAYKVPREWEVVHELPFNHSGKVLRRVLQEREDQRREAAT